MRGFIQPKNIEDFSDNMPTSKPKGQDFCRCHNVSNWDMGGAPYGVLVDMMMALPDSSMERFR